MLEKELKVKRLNEFALTPKYETPGASGFDIASAERRILMPGSTVKVLTGLAFEVPEGYELQIRPRSGISLKTPLMVKNAPGTIDSDYRGEVGVILHYLSDCAVSRPFCGGTNAHRGPDPYYINIGDRIAQAVLVPIVRAKLVDAYYLSETDRGEGGFGHTGMGTGDEVVGEGVSA